MNLKIKSNFLGWDKVAENLKQICNESENNEWLNEGQRKSILGIAENIPYNGMIVADEVGMGKTRIAVALAKAVTRSGGRVAVLIPPGLGKQWKDEFRKGSVIDIKDPIRSLNGYINNWPENGWFGESIILISHLFSNWRHKENSDSGRFALLPEIYAWLRKENRRIPKNYIDWSSYYSNMVVKKIAKQIVAAIPKDKSNPARRKLIKLSELEWNEDIFISSSYTNHHGETLRNHLKTCVGLGFGVFDLIILDEAHKNRGTDTGLSKLLDQIICKDDDHRVLGLTATPVELKLDDWLSTLRRINIARETEALLEESITRYEEVVKTVRNSGRFCKEDIEHFKAEAKRFRKAFQPFLIRRDKREDISVQKFETKSNLPYYRYRKEKEILIDPEQIDFPKSWRKAICAAESLSFVTSLNNDSFAKRFRLTLANGHGIGAWLDNSIMNDGEENMLKADESVDNENKNDKKNSIKKAERILYWKKMILKAVTKKENNLFEHPAIISTITSIEEGYTINNEKVLVFGKFTKPMKALVSLINAREMLRRLDKDEYWPQFSISSEENAVKYALLQLKDKLIKDWDIGKIKAALQKNGTKIELYRKKFRRDFFKLLKEGYQSENKTNMPFSLRLMELLKSDLKKHEEVYLLITRACYERAFGSQWPNDTKVEPGALWSIYEELIFDVTDYDSEEDDTIKDTDLKDLEEILDVIKDRLIEEYGVQSAKFARLMFGETSHHARILMQSEFNRAGSFPFVLVAQSIIGREGLNLHKACKTVIMLHPEWNPGVAEQQIGRVDRLGSLWSIMIDKYIGDPENVPQIEIRPVIFKNTYDEQNWNVLMERWDNLKAQLHGIIIPERIINGSNAEEQEMIRDINAHAPDFSP